MSLINFPYCDVTYSQSVVILHFKEDAELEVKEIRQLIKAAEKLADSKPYLLLSDARVNVVITSEARKIAANPKEAPLLVANAVLVNNLGLSLTANFFMKFNKPHFPVKVFYNEAAAMEWLLKFKL
ncbi:MAG: hypothetical protein ACJ77K_04845 [Bacteroidia bacterium]